MTENEIRFLVIQIKLGTLTLNEIPEEHRSAIETELNNN